jgi:hypothetical protein
LVTKRQSQNPKRRIAAPDRLGVLCRAVLASEVTYVGSALHKRNPGDYGFHPPVNPRPWKSMCDGKRVILKDEASELLRQGIRIGLFSDFPDGGRPKYIWAVDADGEVYEAKIDSNGYHGYRLEHDDDFRSVIMREWSRRCRPL